MAETVQEHEFVEIEYTGTLTDGVVFDTTNENIAKEHNLYAKNRKFGPVIICIGEAQILPGLEKHVAGKEVGKEYTITLGPEDAFGKRDVKKVKIVPFNTFKEHKVEPYPGLQIDVDGELGTVLRVTGGRVLVNFNHPLSGKEVVYKFKILQKVTDPKTQLTTYLHSALQIRKEDIKVHVADEKASIELPF